MTSTSKSQTAAPPRAPFVLVRLPHSDLDYWHLARWRATRVTKEKTTDIFFFAATIEDARAHVRARHPGAFFSDQTISEQLAALGIRHERTPDTPNTGEHKLFRGDEYLGYFTAHRAVQTFLTTDGESNADDSMRSTDD